MSSADFPRNSDIKVMPESDECIRFPILYIDLVSKIRTKQVLKTNISHSWGLRSSFNHSSSYGTEYRNFKQYHLDTKIQRAVF